MKTRWLSLALTLLSPRVLHSAETQRSQPNIVVVLVDDLGFSDIGCYGSEIDTPNIDRLAEKGLRFTQFYNTAKCHASRISLLTGRYPYQAGNRSLTRSVTVPEVLGSAGYFTAMTGKWHLDKQPTDFGFQRYFGHLSGSCNYYTGDDTFRLNGQPWTVPSTGFYTTVADVDHALDFLGEARTEKKPWFLYVAFNAPHSPLQPLEQDYKKYLGRYDAGWDVLRTARIKKQEQLCLFDRSIDPCPRPDHIPAWDKLTPEQREWESRRMAAYAALIDRVDQELGRLLENIRTAGELDNTFILFVSDNGASPYDKRNNMGQEKNPFDPESSWSLGTGWAWMSNSPFRLYKQNQFEGGIATPAIIHWPAGLKTPPGAIVHSPAHLVDVLPTLAEIAGAEIPQSWPGRELSPLGGISLAPILAGQQIASRPSIFLHYNIDYGLRDGDWKIASFQRQPWELYNIAQDRTELHNVIGDHPEMAQRMITQWQDMAANAMHVPAKQCGPVAEIATEQRHNEWTDYGTGDSTDKPKKAKKRRAGKNTAGTEGESDE